MRTTQTTRGKRDESIRVPVTAEEKGKLFEAAAEQDTSVADLIRRAVRAQLPQLAA